MAAITTTPAIFTVLVFRPTDTEEGQVSCHSHLVAACSDAEAERSITEFHHDHLVNARCFIQTAESINLSHAPAVRLYVDTLRSDLMTQHEFERWVKTSTQESFDGSESYPATFREFSVH